MNFRLVATCPPAWLLFSGIAQAQQLPKSAAIGSNPPGSLFYALASGMAKVISEAHPIQTPDTQAAKARAYRLQSAGLAFLCVGERYGQGHQRVDSNPDTSPTLCWYQH